MSISDLYDAHAPRLVAFFSRRLIGEDLEMARDLAGDVWLKVAGRLAVGDDIGPGLLYHMARHRLIDHYRSRRPAAALADGHAAPDAIDGLADAADVRAALAALDPRSRAIVLSRFWLGLDRDETAARLGMTMIAAKSAQQRALAALRAALATSTPTATTEPAQCTRRSTRQSRSW